MFKFPALFQSRYFPFHAVYSEITFISFLPFKVEIHCNGNLPPVLRIIKNIIRTSTCYPVCSHAQRTKFDGREFGILFA
jgi:hypothetical protein